MLLKMVITIRLSTVKPANTNISGETDTDMTVMVNLMIATD